ncbi:hypothetical protein GCM10017673_46230 [Streptosporangium violaceochromogenes]|nr:hypothetical protein GCM10017673_46230 [Streptosporangium violaceochromogenes]
MEKREVDRHASKKLAAVLRAEISQGGRAPGTRLPTVRQLADQYGVAVNTAAAAVRLLQAEGLVVVRPSSGTYVCDQTDGPPDVRTELEDVREQLRQTRDALSATEKTVAALLERLTDSPSGATSEDRTASG